MYQHQQLHKGSALITYLLTYEDYLNNENFPLCRFVGGTQAEYGEFPSFVTVFNSQGGSGFCLGSLISDRWVATTANCCELR